MIGKEGLFPGAEFHRDANGKVGGSFIDAPESSADLYNRLFQAGLKSTGLEVSFPKFKPQIQEKDGKFAMQTGEKMPISTGSTQD